MAAFILSNTQEVKIGEVTGVDRKGNPAPIENVTPVVSSDESVLSVVDRADGRWAVANQIGTAQLTCQADARIGEGEVILVAAVDVEVVPAEAVALSIPLGERQEQE